MGYVEDIKKINMMAKELISHGMASSFDEAVQKATKMIGEGVSVTENRDFMPSHKLDQSKTKEVSAEKAAEKVVEEAKDERTGMTWQEAMAKNNEYIVKMLKEFQKTVGDFHTKISGMESSIQELSRRQTKMSEMVVAAPKGSQEINIDVDEPAAKPQAAPQPKPQEKRESHPRQGNYKPEDVAVENVFYFGNKKQ